MLLILRWLFVIIIILFVVRVIQKGLCHKQVYQIKILQNRTSDDPFIPNLRQLEEELNTTSLVRVNYNDVRVAEVDQLAIEPKKKYSPRRTLIVLLGTFFGILFGFFYLLISHLRK